VYSEYFIFLQQIIYKTTTGSNVFTRFYLRGPSNELSCQSHQQRPTTRRRCCRQQANHDRFMKVATNHHQQRLRQEQPQQVMEWEARNHQQSEPRWIPWIRPVHRMDPSAVVNKETHRSCPRRRAPMANTKET
jgi:hypothetical protein